MQRWRSASPKKLFLYLIKSDFLEGTLTVSCATESSITCVGAAPMCVISFGILLSLSWPNLIGLQMMERPPQHQKQKAPLANKDILFKMLLKGEDQKRYYRRYGMLLVMKFLILTADADRSDCTLALLFAPRKIIIATIRD